VFGSRVGGTGRVLAGGGGVCGALSVVPAVCADEDAVVISAVTIPASSFDVFTMLMIVKGAAYCKTARRTTSDVAPDAGDGEEEPVAAR
jgi:hypothetical protein